jgi:hypothetical protein
MHFVELLQGKNIQILVDFGSTHTFISEVLVSSVDCHQRLVSDVKVQIANGGILNCSSILPDVEWFVEGHKFASHLKVLPLGHFDMILGMDWLEIFSPMQVHWKHKWMAIPYKGTTAVLQGIALAILEEVVMHVCSIIDNTPVEDSSIRPEVDVILEDFAAVFEPLSNLPQRGHVTTLYPRSLELNLFGSGHIGIHLLLKMKWRNKCWKC